MNKIIIGDNFLGLETLTDESVDLVYLDPPFNTGRDFKSKGYNVAEGGFKDTWGNDEQFFTEDFSHEIMQFLFNVEDKSLFNYLKFMTPRLVRLNRVLKEQGSLYLHCDSNAVHYLKVLCDFTLKISYQNTIIWRRSGGKQSVTKRFGRQTDHILFYSSKPKLNTAAIRVPYKEEYVKKEYTQKDERGIYNLCPLVIDGIVKNGKSGEVWHDIDPANMGGHWSAPKDGEYVKYIQQHIPNYTTNLNVIERLDLLYENKFVHFPKTTGRLPRYKRYYTGDAGLIPGDCWDDIQNLVFGEQENVDYPTQKPEELLKRIILASSNEKDVVLDPFAGSGTTAVVAENLGRKWVIMDSNTQLPTLYSTRQGRKGGLLQQMQQPYEVIEL